MKKSFAIVIAVLFISAASVMADVPHMINYQGYLTDTGGEPLDTTVAMTFTMYDAVVGGVTLWSESHPSITVQEGFFDTLLGSVNAIPDSVFDDTLVWLGITVGGDSEMDPRTRVVSVAYAYRVGTVDGASGGTISGKVNIGSGNTNAGYYAFVAGQDNTASGDYASVGGYGNDATGYSATVSGGYGSNASGQYSTVSGGRYNDASLNYATVSGGYANDAGYMGSVGGGSTNIASGSYAVVGCGQCNRARGDYSVVAGGGGASLSDSNSATGNYSAIGGGRQNGATANYTTVSGGNYNRATDEGATVGGGQNNTASYLYPTVSGGQYNLALGDYSVVAGGGGLQPEPNSAIGNYSAIGGGLRNITSGYGSTIAGGENNYTDSLATVGGGKSNMAGGAGAVIGGGHFNFADGDYGIVPGGNYNSADGNYSFAAGRNAWAYGDGSFAWSDATTDTQVIAGINQFEARACGGFHFYTNSMHSSGARLSAGASAWTAVSDSTKKRNIRLVDTQEILDKVARLPIKQWSYRTQDPSIEHIGPMAQDFWKLFHLGEDSLGISTIDPDGIALAAIQELHKENEELRNELNELHSLVEKMAVNSTIVPAGLRTQLGGKTIRETD